jgi:hypothetical protein
MAKLTLADVSSLMGNPTSAATTINANSTLIETALENTLSRDGTTPNQMEADIDMNNNDLLNAGDVDVESLTIAGIPIETTTELADASYNPGVTGVVAPYVSMRNRLRVNLDATSIKLAGDGATDDQPEIMNVLTDIASWGGGRFHLNSYRTDTVFAVGDSIAVPDNVFIYGDGDGATEVTALGDYPVFTNIGTLASGRNRGGIKFMTIRGGGNALTNAHGVQMEWSNRFVLEGLRFHACYDALNYHDVWQVWMDKLSVDGGGDDQSFRGLHATGHDVTNPNNAVIASNVMVQNTIDTGYRLQYFNGSKFVNCELAGAGNHGWHLGDPDAATGEVQWGHFSNILSDTVTNDLWRMEKGASSDVKQIGINNLWLGTSSAGDGLAIYDASLIEITGLKIANINKSGIRLTRCSRMNITGVNIDTTDRANASHPAIRLTDSSRVGLIGGDIYVPDRASKGVLEEVVSGTTDFNRIIGVDVDPNGITRVGARTIVDGCGGYRTHNSGTSDVAIGTSSTTVTHGLAETPVNGDIMIVPRFDINLGGVARYWVDTLTSTTFKINVNTNVSGNTIAFAWTADISRR